MTQSTYRPPSLLNLPHELLSQETDKAVSRIYEMHGYLDGVAIKAPVAGFAVLSGQATITGSKTGIASGLASVQTVVVSIDNGSIATNFTVTGRVAPTDHSKIDVFVWQPTAAGNTTPIACTSPVSVHWWVTGVSG
jgi:hypothetical protein